MDGVIKLPLAKGRKELTWYVGVTQVNGTSQQNPTINLRVDKDADFVMMRGPWLVMWPSYSSPQDPKLALPQTASVILRDGSTRRPLSLVAGAPNAIALNTDPVKATSGWLGSPSPYLLQAGTNFFVEIANPAASWSGDLYVAMEGFSIYPLLPPDIPATIEAYAIPGALDANQLISDPSLAGNNIQGQDIKITNDGSGKFLAKGFEIQCVDNSGAGNDVTAKIVPALGVQITDSTSGGKQWFRNPSLSSGILPFCPAGIPWLSGARLPFNRPRLIDENGNIDVQVIFPNIAAALTFLGAGGGAGITWPVQFTVSLWGVRIPR
jgi:hypothetical protein